MTCADARRDSAAVDVLVNAAPPSAPVTYLPGQTPLEMLTRRLDEMCERREPDAEVRAAIVARVSPPFPEILHAPIVELSEEERTERLSAQFRTSHVE